MSENPMVSVIIPVYNVEDYIQECIDSVISQTYRNLEIILVDDFSSDNCPQICDDYSKKDSRIIVIHKKYNSGPSDTRNAGLKISRGEYIYFLDSDDYIEKDAIEALLFEAKYHNVDIVFFDAKIIRNRDHPNYPPDTYLRKGLYSKSLKGTEMLANLLRYKEYRSPVSLYFIHRKLLIENKLSFYPGIVHEDELFTFKLFLYSNIE